MTGDEGYKQNAVVAVQPGFGRPLPMERVHSHSSQQNIARWAYFLGLAGDEGFEPPNVGTRTRCLTTWRIPNGCFYISTIVCFCLMFCIFLALYRWRRADKRLVNYEARLVP